MLANLLYISIALLVTFVVVYFASGVFFYMGKKIRNRKDIRYFEEKVRDMEQQYNNSEYFQSLDLKDQKALEDNLKRYRTTLSDLKNNSRI